VQVFHLAQLLVGKKIVQGEPPRISGIAGAELQPGLAWDPRARQLYCQFRGQPDQLLGDGDNLHRDRGQAETRRQPGSKQFIDQDTAVLRLFWNLTT
jgi:hypothetical protein